MTFIECPNREKCIYVEIYGNSSPVIYLNKSTNPTNVCKYLHPGETKYNMLVRTGVIDTH